MRNWQGTVHSSKYSQLGLGKQGLFEDLSENFFHRKGPFDDVKGCETPDDLPITVRTDIVDGALTDQIH